MLRGKKWGLSVAGSLCEGRPAQCRLVTDSGQPAGPPLDMHLSHQPNIR